MARLLLSIALVAAAAAERCSFARHPDACPSEGMPCDENSLCQPGLYCKVDEMGQDGSSYSGRCAKGPSLDDVYNKPCDLGTDFRSCQYDNDLAMSPYAVPSYLRCVKSPYTDRAGTCLLGPNKHGDGCNQNGECASGHCLTELRICRGVDEGEECAPGYPDPCMPNHYCAPDPNAEKGGRCQKAVTAGKACNYATACERGTFCAGDSPSNRRCVPLFSVPVGQNVSIGPFMCQTGTAIIARSGPDLPSSLYQCVFPNATLVGATCNSAEAAPLGYECKCAADGEMRLATVRGIGTGSRTQAFQDLFKCLLTATNPMGDPCEFDSTDLEQVRYGSCAFYACYPFYQRLVNATGGRFFTEPLDQFQPTSTCETAAAADFYGNVASTPCIRIPNMENWKCAALLPPASLSVQDTAGVISFIFILVGGSYIAHMYKFRRENRTKVPCVRH